MDLSGRKDKKTSVVLKWTVLLTVISLGFVAYVAFVHLRESVWSQPLSVNISISNLTVASVLQGEEVVKFGKKTTLGPKKKNPTPKVALLFLTKGSLPHEPLWRAFFEAASELSLRHPPPNLDYLNSISGRDRENFNVINKIIKRKLLQYENKLNITACQEEKQMLESEIERLIKVADEPSSVISNQLLFNVYSHPKPDFQFPATSIFYQTEVKNRIDTSYSWGKFKLVAAELRLMKAALKDTRNKKFILLSESCIPLYPPEVIYAQLMSEHKSRMRSCGSQTNVDFFRFSKRMKWKYFKRNNWRKNDQWFALNRAHAEVLVNDTYFKNLFRWYCNGVQGRRFCVADEHYIPSALDAYGLGNQTDCTGMLTYVKFIRGSHPVTFQPSVVRPSLLLELRHKQECDAGTARTTAAALLDGIPRHGRCIFRNLTNIDSSNERDLSHNWVTERGYEPLNHRCVLFARKFPATAVRQTLWASLSCKGGSLGYWC